MKFKCNIDLNKKITIKISINFKSCTDTDCCILNYLYVVFLKKETTHCYFRDIGTRPFMDIYSVNCCGTSPNTTCANLLGGTYKIRIITPRQIAIEATGTQHIHNLCCVKM